MSSPTVPFAFGADESGVQAALKPGDVLEGKYVVRKRVGQGGMGSVFLADELALECSVVIKVLHPELIGVPGLARRMHDEAMLACRVRSRHCVEVFDWGVLPDGAPYLVMEHVPGRPLGRVIADGIMPLPRALDLFDQILSALAATHDCGIVHGDVKSDNFLVELVDGSDHVTMIDFGLAQVIGAPRDADLAPNDLVISGTPEYMAPEVVAGDPPLPTSDLYGAGVILYELLTGTMPFRGGTAMEIMVRQARDHVIPPSKRCPDRGIPAEIDRVVLEALDKRPEARFPDAEAFARALQAAAGALCASRHRPLAREDGTMRKDRAGQASAAGSRRRMARGSDCGDAMRGDIETLRRSIGGALRSGDVAAIADGYLEMANALVQRHQVDRAARELQEGIDVLTAGCDPRARDTPPRVDELVVALAALYDDAGDPRHARHVAMSTDRSPTWTCGIDRVAIRE